MSGNDRAWTEYPDWTPAEEAAHRERQQDMWLSEVESGAECDWFADWYAENIDDRVLAEYLLDAMGAAREDAPQRAEAIGRYILRVMEDSVRARVDQMEPDA